MVALTRDITLEAVPAALRLCAKQIVTLTVRNAGAIPLTDLLLSTRGGLAIRVSTKAVSLERLPPGEAWSVEVEVQPLQVTDVVTLPVLLRWRTPEGRTERHEATLTFSVAPPEAMTPAGAFHALLVGADHYDDPRLPDLPSAASDATALAAALTEAGARGYRREHVALLTGEAATAAGLRDALAALAGRLGADDTLFLFLSARGCRGAGPQSSGGALCLRDARVDDLAATALSSTALEEALAALAARRLFVVLDVSHAPGAARLKALGGYLAWRSGLPEEALRQLAAGEGRVVLTATGGDQPARLHHEGRRSLFGYHLAAALQDRSSHALSALDLHGIVARALRRETPDQTPALFVARPGLDFPVLPARPARPSIMKKGHGRPVRPRPV